MKIKSKLPNVGTTIFTVMSALANEHNAINLSQGFPDFDCPDLLKQLVNKHLQGGKNQYVPMAGIPLLRERLAAKIQRMYGHVVNPDTEITITAGATQALFTAIATFIHSGDEVILIEPAYDCYRPAIEVVGGIPVAYELSAPDYQIDWDAIQQLVSDKTKMIIINTPQNPIGKTLKAADLMALEKLTFGTDILVLSDEVYEHLIYDGAPHQSVLRYPDLFKRSLAVYSFGKTFHNTGWKIGYCVGPDYLMKEFRKVHQFNVFSVNSFVQYGIADFLEDPEPYLSLPGFYQQKRDFFGETMLGSRFKPLSSEGTYFQLFDYSEISNEPDTDFAKRLTMEHGVAAIPVSVFYSSGRQDNMIRLCFAKTEAVLESAGKKLKKV
ncbi:MAG: methionine aminotransferase [Saprospiraceae bacterium]|jgi:methionine aminotransferase